MLNHFKKNNAVTAIQRLKAVSEKGKRAEALLQQLQLIEKEILITAKSLIQAQVIIFKSTISKKKTWINQLQSNFYEPSLRKSIDWHLKELKVLYKRKKRIEEDLYKAKGIFWRKKIEDWLRFILIAIMIVFCASLLIMGLITAIYILPIFLSLIILYMISQGKLRGMR